MEQNVTNALVVTLLPGIKHTVLIALVLRQAVLTAGLPGIPTHGKFRSAEIAQEGQMTMKQMVHVQCQGAINSIQFIQTQPHLKLCATFVKTILD
jgi:proteasome assembly chaperone (PAC2) family protein